MRGLIASRRRELTEGPKRDLTGGDNKQGTSEHRDVFRLMLEASEQEGKYALDDDELVSTILHETARNKNAGY